MLPAAIAPIIILILTTGALSYELVLNVSVIDSVLFKWQVEGNDEIEGRLVHHRFPPEQIWETATVGGLEARKFLDTKVSTLHDSLVFGCGLVIKQPVNCPSN